VRGARRRGGASRLAVGVVWAAVLGLACGCGSGSGSGGAGEPVVAPDFELERMDGESAVSLAGLRGKTVIIDFWATWCPPCRREMPLLDLANQTYQSQGRNIVGIAVGESKETVRRYIDSTGITYPIWVNADTDDNNQTHEIFDKYGGTGLPTTIFADRQGVIRKFYVGELSRGFIDSEVKKLLLQTN